QGVKIFANNKVDLMAAYLGLLGFSNAPQISVNRTVVEDTVQVGEISPQVLVISNSGGPLAPDLFFTITENPDVSWLTVSPTADTVAGGQSVDVIVGLDATDLTAGDYTTTLEIASNDSANPLILVDVLLHVENVTGIEEPGIPSTYAVTPNFPNPFNPSTTIKYQVPENAEVVLEIYNVLGQKVRTLVNQVLTPGSYEAIWDGRNDQGVALGSGIYMYRFEVKGKFQRTHKMILLK
ncbi:MAG: T9SS C-terminal target domain-containing protein, partial [Methanobacteriota archaeon]